MNLLAPFLIGLFSSIHCLVMCGGLCAVFCRNNPNIATVLFINLGRILTYTILGLIFAGIVQGLALRIPMAEIGFWMRSALGLILVFLGIRIVLNKSSLPSYIENSFVWKKAKIGLHVLSQKSSVLSHVSKGMLWGLIPCGLLYGVLMAAATTHNTLHGGSFMLAFGLGTLPSMFISAGIVNQGKKYLELKSLRYGAGSFIIVIGVWSIISPWFSHNLIPENSIFIPIIAFLDSCIP